MMNMNNIDPVERMLLQAGNELGAKLEALNDDVAKNHAAFVPVGTRIVDVVGDFSMLEMLHELYTLGCLTQAGVTYADAMLMRLHQAGKLAQLDLRGRKFVNTYQVSAEGSRLVGSTLVAPGSEQTVMELLTRKLPPNHVLRLEDGVSAGTLDNPAPLN